MRSNISFMNSSPVYCSPPPSWDVRIGRSIVTTPDASAPPSPKLSSDLASSGTVDGEAKHRISTFGWCWLAGSGTPSRMPLIPFVWKRTHQSTLMSGRVVTRRRRRQTDQTGKRDKNSIPHQTSAKSVFSRRFWCPHVDIRALAAAAMALVALTPAAAHATAPHRCGNLLTTFQPVGEGQARHINATHITCTRARRVAHDCLHGNGRGWTVLLKPQTDRDYEYHRTIMKRANATVTFEIVGGGHCQ